MPRAVRDTKLDTPTARQKLVIDRHPYKRSLEQGLILLYYRGKNRGSWSVRLYNSKAGKYEEHKLGLANDHRHANGIDVLDFKQAQVAAKNKAEEISLKKAGKIKSGPYTVKDAIDEYIDWARSNRKSHKNIENRLNRHVIPHFGEQLVQDLTRDEIEKWHRKLSHAPAQVGGHLGKNKKGEKKKTRMLRKDPDPRARKVTANRTLAYFKAALSRAHIGGKVLCNPVWKTVEQFKGVEKARVDCFTEKEIKRLINVAVPELKSLLQAALYTGCRFSEIANLKCNDFDSKKGTIFIGDSKANRTRYIPLTAEGTSFFSYVAAGKLSDEYLFLNSNGEHWKQLDNKAFNEARTIAKVNPKCTFHSLRHTYASLMLNNGASLEVISKILGHHSISITEKYYAHMAESVKKQAVEKYLPSFGFNAENEKVVSIGENKKVKRK